MVVHAASGDGEQGSPAGSPQMATAAKAAVRTAAVVAAPEAEFAKLSVGVAARCATSTARGSTTVSTAPGDGNGQSRGRDKRAGAHLGEAVA